MPKGKGTKGNGTALKKKGFLSAFEKSYGNITQSCLAIGINRKTYYRWLKDDPEFAEDVETTQPRESLIDLAESKLVQAVRDGDLTAIIYTLKSQGRSRGWNERLLIEQKEVRDIDGKSEEEVIAELKKLREKHAAK